MSNPSFKVQERLPSGHCIVKITGSDDDRELGMYAIMKPNGWFDSRRFETVTDACVIAEGMVPAKAAEDELSQFEQKVLIDALRKAIKDPLAMSLINEVRENLIDRINNGEITIAKLF